MLDTVLTIFAAISFGLAAAKVSAGLDWVPLGFCLLTITLLV